MDRLAAAFQNRPVFMPYFPVGYPEMDLSIDVLEALAKHGADVIEVGLSFSDPIADGPVIQHATQVALQNGVTLRHSFAAVAELRRRGVEIPLILMGYYNPILSFGLPNFVQAAQNAGADGFIIPDLPAEESADFEEAAGELPLIRMIAPTTPPERVRMLAEKARGFIYLVSVSGTTGERAGIAEGLQGLVERVRSAARVPVCVGFGISTPRQAAAVGSIADGVIIGSACVKAIGESQSPVTTARDFAMKFKQAIKKNMF